MQSKELSMQVKQAILQLKNQQFGTFWGKRNGELGNTKRPGRPRKTTPVDNRRILSMVKKNPFTTSSEVRKTLQELGVSISKSTMKRRPHKSKYRGFTTRC